MTGRSCLRGSLSLGSLKLHRNLIPETNFFRVITTCPLSKPLRVAGRVTSMPLRSSPFLFSLHRHALLNRISYQPHCVRVPMRAKTGYKDPFTVLGVPRGTSPAELKRAYRKLVSQYHPDKAAPENRAEYEQKLSEINAAWDQINGKNERTGLNESERYMKMQRLMYELWLRDPSVTHSAWNRLFRFTLKVLPALWWSSLSCLVCCMASLPYLIFIPRLRALPLLLLQVLGLNLSIALALGSSSAFIAWRGVKGGWFKSPRDFAEAAVREHAAREQARAQQAADAASQTKAP